MLFPRRKCFVFCRKLFVAFILAFFCVSVLNLLCFSGECYVSEDENNALSSLSDVVWEANKLPNSVDRNAHSIKMIAATALTEAMDPQKKKLDVHKKMKSLNLTSLDFCPKEKDYLRHRTLFIGQKEPYGPKRFLSVGIPSIGRKTKSYLKKTLISIFNGLHEDKRGNITIVVFLADFDEEIKQKQLSDINQTFENYITTGILQIIQAPPSYYMPLKDLHRNLGDHMDRVMWRSKQALDYVYLMCYCSYLSQYYLQLEDDVIASPQFLSKIIDFINSQKSEWISLNVALLGYIGKLYPVREVQNLASYLRLFFNEMPVDWLEPRWKKYRGVDPRETKCRAASLFQHIGFISSFRPKESQSPNTLKEQYFDHFEHKYLGLNPPAEISSNLVPVHGKPLDAYAKGDGYFLARFGSAGSKMYDIFLEKATKLKRVVVETGANNAERDFILTATLQVSATDAKTEGCTDYQVVQEFKFGKVDVPLKGRKVRCIRINIIYQGRWIYFREINVWKGGKE